MKNVKLCRRKIDKYTPPSNTNSHTHLPRWYWKQNVHHRWNKSAPVNKIWRICSTTYLITFNSVSNLQLTSGFPSKILCIFLFLQHTLLQFQISMTSVINYHNTTEEHKSRSCTSKNILHFTLSLCVTYKYFLPTFFSVNVTYVLPSG